MTMHTSSTISGQSANKADSKRGVRNGDDESGAFDLRDTLKGIAVREANFTEFLAALKHFGAQAGKR